MKEQQRRFKNFIMADQPNQKQPNVELPLSVHAQYIKDMSFENPNAPDSLRGGKDNSAPQMHVDVQLDSRELDQKGVYEVVMHVNSRAVRGETTLFIAELVYGVVVSVAKNVPQDHVHPLIMIETPKLAFPFVRQSLCDAVMAGGYPPLMLNPVNFEQLYIAQYQAEQKKSKDTSDQSSDETPPSQAVN